VAPVARLAGVVLAEEEAVGLEERREGSEADGLELAETARGLVGAVLLLIELGVDPHVLELLEDELHVVHELRRSVGREAHAGLEAVGMAGGGEEPLGLGGIVAVVLRALAELRDRQRPVVQRGRQGPLTAPTPSKMDSIWALRSMARHMAWRTRTSEKGALSARRKMSLTTLDGNSATWRPGAAS
jgi:hypothetical protein